MKGRTLSSMIVEWVNGHKVGGHNATHILRVMMRQQWEPIPDTNAMKRRLSERAWALDGLNLDETLPDDQFLLQCAEVGLLTISDAA